MITPGLSLSLPFLYSYVGVSILSVPKSYSFHFLPSPLYHFFLYLPQYQKQYHGFIPFYLSLLPYTISSSLFHHIRSNLSIANTGLPSVPLISLLHTRVQAHLTFTQLSNTFPLPFNPLSPSSSRPLSRKICPLPVSSPTRSYNFSLPHMRV